MSARPLTSLLAGCLVAALISLLLPYGPLYDSWSWLVWGRELASLSLDTGAGPSWKPLPALIDAPLSLLGAAAPGAWLMLARMGWFMAPILAWRLAARMAGPGRRGAAAGVVAAVGVVLLSDDFTSWTRQGTGGLAEPLLVAIVLAAVDAGLERRSRRALWLAFAACLIRPEAWPFAAIYAWREARSGRVAAAPVVTAALAVAALWLVSDLLAAGDALEGASRARGGAFEPGNGLDTFVRALVLPLAGLWVAAALAVRSERRACAHGGEPGPGKRPAGVLAAGAAAWIGLVVVMAAAGFAGLPRFMAPAAAIVCVLGGVGVARLGASRRAPALIAATLALALSVQAAWRATEIPGELRRAAADQAAIEPLLDLASERPEAFACAPLATADFRAQPPLAWALDRPLAEITPTSSAYTPAGTLVIGPRTDPELEARARAGGTQLADTGDWAVVRLGSCSGAAR